MTGDLLQCCPLADNRGFDIQRELWGNGKFFIDHGAQHIFFASVGHILIVPVKRCVSWLPQRKVSSGSLLMYRTPARVMMTNYTQLIRYSLSCACTHSVSHNQQIILPPSASYFLFSSLCILFYF